MAGINDLDACQRVATMRRAGIPDAFIARELGISLERLRVVCPDDGADPLGLNRDRERSGVKPPTPHRPRGHVGDPFAGVAPYVPPSDDATLSAPPGGGDAIALLVIFLLLGG